MAPTRFTIGPLASVVLLTLGIIALAFFLSPMENSFTISDKIISIQPGEIKTIDCSINMFNCLVEIIVPDGTITTCNPLNNTAYQAWKSHGYTPFWYQTSEHRCSYIPNLNWTLDLDEGSIGTTVQTYTIHMLFQNEGSLEKNVHVLVTGYETVQNTRNIWIAYSLIISGSVIGISLIIAAITKHKRAIAL